MIQENNNKEAEGQDLSKKYDDYVLSEDDFLPPEDRRKFYSGVRDVCRDNCFDSYLEDYYEYYSEWSDNF